MTLFFGALVQWALTAASVRYLSVAPSMSGVVITTFVMQSIWWWNIQAVKRTDRWQDWLAWSVGAAVGAAAGFILTGGR